AWARLAAGARANRPSTKIAAALRNPRAQRFMMNLLCIPVRTIPSECSRRFPFLAEIHPLAVSHLPAARIPVAFVPPSPVSVALAFRPEAFSWVSLVAQSLLTVFLGLPCGTVTLVYPACPDLRGELRRDCVLGFAFVGVEHSGARPHLGKPRAFLSFRPEGRRFLPSRSGDTVLHRT